MAIPKVRVKFDGQSKPEFLDIDCSDMDKEKTVELIINGVVRATVYVGSIIPAEQDSNLYLETWSSPSTAILPSLNSVVTYAITSERIKIELSDFDSVEGKIDEDGNIVLSKSDTSGNTMELRYKL